MCLLKSALERIIPQSHSANTATQVSEEVEPLPKKRKTLFNFMESDSSSSQSQNQPSTLDKMGDYLETVSAQMSTDPAKYWRENQKKYPFLAMLAKDVLGVPSSSAPVERLFSIAGKVFTPERCRLTDKRFEQLMFIRCNHAHTSQ